jgi:hypothetical protein
VELDDRPADRQPQPEAVAIAGVAADELLEDALAETNRQPRATIEDRDRDDAAPHERSHLDRARLRRVLQRVVGEVDQGLLEQHGIDPQQRRVGRERDLHRAIAEPALEPEQRRADHLLEGEPLGAQHHTPGLQSGHVEQVADHLLEALGLVRHGREQLVALLAAESLALQRGGSPGDHR